MEDKDEILLAGFIARDYHGGQSSALYAFVSSGSITPGLAREAAQAAYIAEDALVNAPDEEVAELLRDAEILRALARYAEEKEGYR